MLLAAFRLKFLTEICRRWCRNFKIGARARQRLEAEFACILSLFGPKLPTPCRSGSSPLPAWEDGGGPLDAADARFRPRRRLRAAAGQSPAGCRGRTTNSAACCSASKSRRPRNKNLFLPGKLADLLPSGNYRFANAPHDARLAALAFALGSYRFTRYRKSDGKTVRLEIPESVDAGEISRIVEAAFLARDLINTPANDMGPGGAGECGARCGDPIRCENQRDRRRRSAGTEFSADPRRRPRRRGRRRG